MPLYEYRCPEGHTLLSTYRDTKMVCPHDFEIATRRFHFNFRPSMPTHFNHSVGAYVGNNKQIVTALKVKSDELSERTGFSHDLQPISPYDVTTPASLGVTEQGLDHTAKRKHDLGIPS